MSHHPQVEDQDAEERDPSTSLHLHIRIICRITYIEIYTG